jgi:hypothetical protein
MTGLSVSSLTQTPRQRPGSSSSLDSSRETRDLAREVAALRNRPSPATLNPGDNLEEKSLHNKMFHALATVKIMTSQVAMHINAEVRERLFKQLDSLHAVEDWEDGDTPIQELSFKTFLKVILTINPERRPGLGLSGGGNLIAAWTTGQDRLTIEFFPHDRVRWILSRHNDGDLERYAGESSAMRLVDGLAAYNPNHWFLRAATSDKPTR